jgi:hypothetical protein
MNAFKKGLSEVGIIEGQNATFEDRVSLMCVLEMGHAQTLDGSLPIPQYGVRVDNFRRSVRNRRFVKAPPHEICQIAFARLVFALAQSAAK